MFCIFDWSTHPTPADGHRKRDKLKQVRVAIRGHWCLGEVGCDSMHLKTDMRPVLKRPDGLSVGYLCASGAQQRNERQVNLNL